MNFDPALMVQEATIAFGLFAVAFSIAVISFIRNS